MTVCYNEKKLCNLILCYLEYLWLISTDDLGDGFGDACVDDSDGDGFADVEDVCPEHKDIHSTDFRSFNTILLDPVGDSQIDPEWHIRNEVSLNFFSVI